MYNIAKEVPEERKVLFTNTAAKMRMPPAVIEKDFWVCYLLDYLFSRSPWRKAMVFKGGTSLSKAYHIIKRFSEDVDLVMDWRLIFSTDEEAWKERSNTQQDKYNKTIIRKASSFLTEKLIPNLQADISGETGTNIEVNMDPDDTDKCTVNIYYPHVFNTEYLRQEIRLEIGPIAEWIPSHSVRISSFAAEKYPQVFQHPFTEVLTIDAERTFWEKITILHKTAASYEIKGIPTRYARHYYDVYCMSMSDVKEKAFERKDLLVQDIRFKKKFYYSKSASYETAKIGSLRLIPCESAIKDLKSDYEHMKLMIYGNVPEFDEIILQLSKLEEEINRIK